VFQEFTTKLEKAQHFLHVFLDQKTNKIVSDRERLAAIEQKIQDLRNSQIHLQNKLQRRNITNEEEDKLAFIVESLENSEAS
jgi:flagellar motility protein MotE (MotC chaperone)